jgi:hypothetical protein
MLETEVKAELGEGYDIARVENVEPVDALIEGSRLYQGLRFDLTVLAPGEESGGLFGWWKKTRPEEALSVTLSVFEQLKDRYPLVLTNTMVLDEGFTIDCPILVGKAHGQIVELYSDGDMFVLDVMDAAQTKGTHWHPYDVEDAVEDISEFMEGKSDYQLTPFQQA